MLQGWGAAPAQLASWELAIPPSLHQFASQKHFLFAVLFLRENDSAAR